MLGPIKCLDFPPRPVRRQESGSGDFCNVARCHPWPRKIEGEKHADRATIERTRVKQQVAHQQTAPQVQHVDTKGVKSLLGGGETVDLADPVPALGADAALEDDPPDRV